MLWHIVEAQGFSAEVESPPAQKAYALRSRLGPQQAPPGFGDSASPEAAAAAEQAASNTQGPLKKRLKVCNDPPECHLH